MGRCEGGFWGCIEIVGGVGAFGGRRCRVGFWRLSILKSIGRFEFLGWWAMDGVKILGVMVFEGEGSTFGGRGNCCKILVMVRYPKLA